MLGFQTTKSFARLVDKKTHRDVEIGIVEDKPIDRGYEVEKEETFEELVAEKMEIHPMIVRNFDKNAEMYEWGTFYIAGPSGSGKSTYIADLMEYYFTELDQTDAPVIFIGGNDFRNDPALNKFRLSQMDLSAFQNPVSASDFPHGSIFLFDDFSSISDDKIRFNVEKLITDILETGRKMRYVIVITNHLIVPVEKNFGRRLLNEIQFLTFFPKAGSVQQIRYVLKTYWGLSNKQIDKILDTRSRWVTITKFYPITVFNSHEIYIL